MKKCYIFSYLLVVVHSMTWQGIKHCHNMSEEDKNHVDDECGKIDFMSIVQSIGSQIKVSIDTGFDGKIPHPHHLQSVWLTKFCQQAKLL